MGSRLSSLSLSLKDTKNMKDVKKEILFFLVSTKANGGGAVFLRHKCENDAENGRLARSIRRMLANLKKSGDILLYIPGESFRTENTTTRYLLDRIPVMGLSKELNQGDDSFTVVYLG